MTSAELKKLTRKALAVKAKRHGILGWHAMRKQELVDALVSASRRKTNAARGKRSSAKATSKPRGTTLRQSKSGRLARPSATSAKAKSPRKVRTKAATNGTQFRRNSGDTANGRNGDKLTKSNGTRKEGLRDRLVASPQGPYWIQAQWQLSRATLQRAEAAMGTEWRVSEPVIRVFDVTSNDETSVSKTLILETRIAYQASTWFFHLQSPRHTYKLQMGFVAPSGRFFGLVNSNRVTLPKPGKFETATTDKAATHTQHRTNQNRGSMNGSATAIINNERPALTGSLGARILRNIAWTSQSAIGDFDFQIDAELIVHGTTHPDTVLMLLGEEVPIREDGTFQLRFDFPDGRQVIPAVAITPNGAEQRTIVLAIERNTKELERRTFDELSG